MTHYIFFISKFHLIGNIFVVSVEKCFVASSVASLYEALSRLDKIRPSDKTCLFYLFSSYAELPSAAMVSTQFLGSVVTVVFVLNNEQRKGASLRKHNYSWYNNDINLCYPTVRMNRIRKSCILTMIFAHCQSLN